MRNEIRFNRGIRKQKRDRIEELLENMNADIVTPNGILPRLVIEEASHLISGAVITLSATGNSKQGYLETDSRHVEYEHAHYAIPPHIRYTETQHTKQGTKELTYNFCIPLAGKRKRQA